jgi:hypothetical protein
VFLKYLNSITIQDRKERISTAKVNADALKKLSCSLEANTRSNKDIADATIRSAKEAKERNGHLAELTMGNRKILNNLINCDEQHVHIQEVDKQRIKIKE